MRINGGYFVFRNEIFDYIRDGEELVRGALPAADRAGQLLAYEHDGFWACMDTFKEKQLLEDLYSRGQRALGGLEASRRDALRPAASAPHAESSRDRSARRSRGRSGSLPRGARRRHRDRLRGYAAAAGRSAARRWR